MRLNHLAQITVAPRLPWLSGSAPSSPRSLQWCPWHAPDRSYCALLRFLRDRNRSRLSLALPTQRGLDLSLLSFAQGLAAFHCPQTSSLWP